MSAQLKLTGIPQSANDEIYNHPKRNLRECFKRNWETFFWRKYNICSAYKQKSAEKNNEISTKEKRVQLSKSELKLKG